MHYTENCCGEWIHAVKESKAEIEKAGDCSRSLRQGDEEAELLRVGKVGILPS